MKLEGKKQRKREREGMLTWHLVCFCVSKVFLKKNNFFNFFLFTLN
jgi:hypothetical protein